MNVTFAVRKALSWSATFAVMFGGALRLGGRAPLCPLYSGPIGRRSAVKRSMLVISTLVGLAAWLAAACGSSDAGKGNSASHSKGPPESGTPSDGSDAGGSGDGGARDSGLRDLGSGDDASGNGGPGDGAIAGGSVIGDATGVTAIRMVEFLDSIGVCAHVAQGVDAPTQSATAMAYAGLRNLRDDGNPNVVGDWIAMHQNAGVRVCVLSNQDVASTLGMAKQLHAAGALLAVEGPNEPNNFPVTYQGEMSSSTTFTPVADFQRL